MIFNWSSEVANVIASGRVAAVHEFDCCSDARLSLMLPGAAFHHLHTTFTEPIFSMSICSPPQPSDRPRFPQHKPHQTRPPHQVFKIGSTAHINLSAYRTLDGTSQPTIRPLGGFRFRYLFIREPSFNVRASRGEKCKLLQTAESTILNVGT